MAREIPSRSATELADGIRAGELTPVEVVDAFLERIADVNPDINAFVTLLEDDARERAREAGRELENGADVGPLHGVPVVVKDLYAYKEGVPNTFGSAPFESYVPDRSAPLVERLEAAGAIVLGKTNTPEFGHKGNTVNRIVGQTRNPFSEGHVPGGSSGGSAAAVASGMAPLGQGSDHAGSIRSPASACHLFGLFPSAGRVPHAFRPDAFKYHLPYAGSGPLARTVEDAALMLDVISGPHPHDPDSLPPTDRPFRDAVDDPIDGLTVAYAPGFRDLPVAPEVREITEDATDAFADAGADVQRISVEFDDWDRLHGALVTGLTVLFTETAVNLRETTGIDILDYRDQVAAPVVDRIEGGREVSALEYRRANNVRTDFYNALGDAFEEVDLLAMPTTVTPPREIGADPPTEINGEPLPSAHSTILTWPFNLTGNPAASVPAGRTDDGLPVGLQLVGPRFDEWTVLAAAAALERQRPWADEYPM